MPTQDYQEKPVWNFPNILAFTVVMSCLMFLFTVPYFMSKFESKDNTMLSQIITGLLGVVMVIIAFYFGSSVGSARQQAQITEMHKTSTELALKTADSKGSASSELKVDKAVAIEQLRAKLVGMEPDSEDAIKILDEIKRLEGI